MRRALRDDDLWQRLISTPGGLHDVELWLKKTTTSIDQQLAYKQTESEEWRLTPNDATARTALGSYFRWRKGALYLKGLCQYRLLELKQRRNNTERNAQRLKDLVFVMAGALRDHELGAIANADLHGLLDQLTLPGEATMTVREYLDHRSQL